MERPKMVDPRQPRVGQAVTGIVLAIGFIAGWPIVLPIIAVILALASLVGGPINPYLHVYRVVKRVLGWGPPRELEEAAPPRFANTVGFVFTLTATILYYPLHLHAAAWVLGVLVSALALLAATTGLCVGCEFYVFARRVMGGERSGVEASA